MGRSMKWKVVLVVLLFVLVAVGGLLCQFNDKEYTVTVTDKERMTKSTQDSDGDLEVTSKYLVFTEDADGNVIVFENTDCLIRGKFNSSDIQGKLKEGHTYKIVAIGYRIPLFSMYENIIKVEEVD